MTRTTLPSKFSADTRGNVAMIFALSSFVAIGVTGGAIDYGRVYSARSELQMVLDSAVLAAGRKYAESNDLAAAQSMARSIFNEHFTGNAPGGSTTPTLDFVATNALVTAKASATVTTPFLSFVAGENIPLAVTSSVSLGGKKLEIALMFDVTGSMDESTNSGNSKIIDAKVAAKDLIDIVLPASGAYDSRMSLIPFSQRVKLDLDSITRVTGQQATKQETSTQTTTWTEYALSTTSYDWVSYSRCVDKLRDDYFRKIGETYSEAEASAEAYCDSVSTRRDGRRTEYKRPDIVLTQRSSTESVSYETYINPCAIERKTTDTTRKYGDVAPTTGEWTATYSKTVQTADASCPPNGTQGKGTLIPLTNSASSLKSAIDDLQTGGGTAGHIGTAWSLYTLSPKWNSIWPSASAPAEYDDEKTMKVAVLMTDGAYNNCNGSQSCTTSDDQAIALCTKMKNDYNITVYTIGFGMSTDETDPARLTLINCASPGKYYFPYDGDELRAAFADIGAALVSGGSGPRLLPADQVSASTTP